MTAQKEFLRYVLPQMGIVFAHVATAVKGRELREELLQESTALAWREFLSTWAKDNNAGRNYPGTICRWAVLHALGGRGLGRSNPRNEPLGHCEDYQGEPLRRRAWHTRGATDVITECVTSGLCDDPARRVEVKLDFQAWFASLSPNRQAMCRALAGGESTALAAHKMGVSSARVSQLRRKLMEDWERFIST